VFLAVLHQMLILDCWLAQQTVQQNQKTALNLQKSVHEFLSQWPASTDYKNHMWIHTVMWISGMVLGRYNKSSAGLSMRQMQRMLWASEGPKGPWGNEGQSILRLPISQGVFHKSGQWSCVVVYWVYYCHLVRYNHSTVNFHSSAAWSTLKTQCT